MGSDSLFFGVCDHLCTIRQDIFLTPKDNYIQNFHLGRYIVGYTVGNLVLRRRASGAVKRDFRTYIRRYTSPNENFEYGYPHSNALLQFHLKLSVASRTNVARHPTKCDVINDVKLFPTVYRRIYCRKFLTLSNQKSRYKSKCIRMTTENLMMLIIARGTLTTLNNFRSGELY